MSYGMDYQGGGGGDTNAYGGGGGGGFSSGGGDAYGAQSSQGAAGGGGAKRNYDDQSCIPVTARMILAAQTDLGDNTQLKLEDDRKLYHIKLVAAVRSVEITSTAVVYSLEDGTGSVDVKQWLDENDCTALQDLREQSTQQDKNIYVKVVGQLKMYNGTKQILATSVRPLSTGNELTHHFLEVVYSGEKYKNESTIVQPTSPSGMMMNNNSAGVGFGSGGGASGGSRTPLMQQGGGGSGDALRDSVLNFIKTNGEHSDTGANVVACVKSLGFGTESEIRSSIDSLEAEGMIYSTINQDNYKCA